SRAAHERRTGQARAEPRAGTPNLEPRTETMHDEPRTTHDEPRTTHDEPRTTHDEPRTTNRHDRCFRIRRAQFRAGAPMMPPPGCVADPHIQRFRIGVWYCAQPGTGRAKNSCSSVNSPWKMLPSVNPNWRSMSSGVSTWRCRMMSRRFGAYSA